MPEPHPESIGRYKVLGVLGKGAMGVVYKAVDPVIDREVAIKTIRLSLSEEELAQYEARFAQEIKTVGKLNHAHIVPIYDVGRTEQFAYMAMEFIDGRELKAYMAAAKPLDVATTVDLVAQVADGLDFAHAREIVHRDVKPSNIMVAATEDGMAAKIMDFGIARAPSSAIKTQTGMILGSPRYMSPEQVVGKNIGPRSDVFSLGVVLYEMLTGTAPFDADTVSSIMYQTVNVREEPVSKINALVAPPLDAVVAKALAKSPDERYATMKDFYRALRDAQKVLPAPGHLVLPAVQPTQTSAGFPAVKVEDLPAIAETAHHVSARFDSFEGTMKLAALAEQGADITRFMKRPPVEMPIAPAQEASPAAQASPAATPGPVAPPDAFHMVPAALLGSLAAIAVVLGVVIAIR
jgi:serine/threonine-protein kinase